MPIHEGKTERILRVVAGLLLLIILPLTLPGAAKWWGLVGLLPLLTGLTGYSPAWTPFGTNTCATRKKDKTLPHRG
ncbi:YgaP-like transmembrane domain [Verrucomicrobium sp. 3C]|uniref:YgaP-like transmembrane domain n=1 Tax=Verrucomicrobium sp. 3C TaxID=1134055 RepID=UPI00036AF878|nr:YgaP-like transmembrane domain [Verrucomicrobium sp. 3C]